MADELVRRAQRFVNTYDVAGIPTLVEDGVTGWATVHALTRVLQFELGLTSLSDSFGPATLAALQSRFPEIDSGLRIAAIARVIQSALYCKGYDGGEIDGTYNARVAASVTRLKQDMGVAGVYPGASLTPKVFKALLTMDPYVLIAGGNPQVRAAQQWLNGRYVTRRDYFIVPAEGFFSRDVQKALMLAIQYELGMADGVANGVFGPATQAGLRTKTLTVGSSGPWASLFTAALCANRRPNAVFAPTFTAATATAVGAFQSFVKLPVTRTATFSTWAALLVSTGDVTRPGTACDGVTTVTDARAKALFAAGYRTVGRYLCNVAGSPLNKMIQPGELATIVANGLRVFPIFQTFGGSAGYFSTERGASDALLAIEWARVHGFKAGTRIYFAVDFDALDDEVTTNVLPHFRAIKQLMDEYGAYRVGVYGPRNVCSRVAAAGLSSASFVSDMSTGYSGNLGYPLPADWAFDQFATVSVGSGAGAIEIDKNVASGRDLGQNAFTAVPTVARLDVDFPVERRADLLTVLQSVMEANGIPEKGGPNAPDVAWPYTTTQAFNVIMGLDPLLTGLARALRMRKALIAVPLFWEIRKFTVLDVVADEGVIAYHTGGGLPGDPTVKRDCSTGFGQIFAATAIDSRNYLVGAGIIKASILDASKDADIWAIWQRLHSDNAFNASTAAHVLIRAANLVGIGRPSLTYSDENTRKCLKRYQGTNAAAEADSYLKLAVYRTLESRFAAVRGG